MNVYSSLDFDLHYTTSEKSKKWEVRFSPPDRAANEIHPLYAPHVSKNHSQRRHPADVPRTAEQKRLFNAKAQDSDANLIAESLESQRVRASACRHPPGRKVKLFFRGLYKRTNKETAAKVFSQYGCIEYLRLPFCKTKNKNMGYGFVVFRDPAVASQVLANLKSVIIDGKTIQLHSYSLAKLPSVPSTSTSEPQAKECDALYCERQPTKDSCQSREASPINSAANQRDQSTSFHSVKPTRSKYFEYQTHNVEHHTMRNVRLTRDSLQNVQSSSELFRRNRHMST